MKVLNNFLFLTYLLGVSLACVPAWGVQSSVHWIALGVADRFESGNNGRDTESRVSPLLSLGRTNQTFGVELTMSSFEKSDGNATVQLWTERLQLGLNLQYTPFAGVDTFFDPYAVAGVGFFQDRVITRLNTQVLNQYGEWNTNVLAGLGFWLHFNSSWRFGVEGHGLYSKSLSPQLVPEFFLKFGFDL